MATRTISEDLRNALMFLALSDKDKAEYTAGRMKARWYEFHGGASHCTGVLDFLVTFCDNAISAEHLHENCDPIDEALRALHGLFWLIPKDHDGPFWVDAPKLWRREHDGVPWPKEFCNVDPRVFAWDALRLMARQVLGLLETEPVLPALSWSELARSL